jgi:hypothetical protein
MKRFILFLIIPLLIGCEKYELPSNPQLNLNGRWDVVDVKVVIDKVNYGSSVRVVNDDKAAVTNFLVQGVNSAGELMLTQDYYGTIVNRRFDESSTKWEFDYYNLRISDSGTDEWMTVDFPCTYCVQQKIIETDYKGQKTRYTFLIDTYGAMPSNELKLTSQVFYTNILINGNQYEKAIESHLEITLHKY